MNTDPNYLPIQVEEGLEKVKVSIRNLKEFKTCFLVGKRPRIQILIH